jgi:hypothetical protein
MIKVSIFGNYNVTGRDMSARWYEILESSCPEEFRKLPPNHLENYQENGVKRKISTHHLPIASRLKNTICFLDGDVRYSGCRPDNE